MCVNHKDEKNYPPLHIHIRVVLASHQGNFSLKQTENITENHKGSKCRWRAQSQWRDLQNTPTPKAQRTLWKRGQKISKSQNFREFALRLSLLLISRATHKIPPSLLPKCELKKNEPICIQTGQRIAHKASILHKEL